MLGLILYLLYTAGLIIINIIFTVHCWVNTIYTVHCMLGLIVYLPYSAGLILCFIVHAGLINIIFTVHYRGYYYTYCTLQCNIPELNTALPELWRILKTTTASSK